MENIEAINLVSLFCIGDKEKIICTPRLRNNYVTIYIYFFCGKLRNYCFKPQDADYPILTQYIFTKQVPISHWY